MEEALESTGTPKPNGPSFSVDAQTIIGGCLVALLILAGLMLPPIALAQRVFGFGYERITAENPTATEDGLTVSLAEPDGTLRVKITTVSASTFNNQQAGARWREAEEALPSTLQLVGSVYEIEGRGQPSSTVLLDLTIPEGTAPSARLDLYTWDSEAGEWVFLPHQDDAATNMIHASLDGLPESVAIFNAQSGAPMLSIVQEPNQTFDPELGTSVNILMPAGLQPASDGSLAGAPAAGALGDFAVVPVIRNYNDPTTIDTTSVAAILADTNLQQTHLNALVNLVVAGGNDGVAIDYRGLTPEQEPAFTAFVTALANSLHDEGKMLVVVLPPPTPGPGPMTWNTGGYNWRALGEVADMLEVQPGVSPADYLSNGRGGQMLTWATGEVSRYKLHLGTSTMSVDIANGVGSPIGYDTALDRLAPTVDPPLPGEGEVYEPGETLTFELGGDDVSNVGVDSATGIYRYDYSEGSPHEVWIVTADKLRERLALALTHSLAGVVARDLLDEGNADGVQQAVIGFKVSAPVITQEGLQVEWVVSAGSGGVVRFDTLDFGAPFSWVAEVEDQLTATVALLDPEKRDSGNLTFVVGAIPVEEEEEEPEPAPVVVADAPAADPAPAAPAAAPPAVSSAGGGFELGGQTHTLGDPELMHQMGMTWAKFQHKWTAGASGWDTSGNIELAHANGFKALISVPGPPNPSSIDFAAYTQYIREVAEAGADGIEIWNEMNLSREWPANDISGTSYVNNMLAPAYNAIKEVDSSILVMNGALAPTGAFSGGCGDLGFVSGCDDYPYVQQMAAAGAANYVDCVGLHYNAGATSPNASSGHPAGGAPSWYYWGTVGTYTPIGKPLCFTELGYLTDEGYESVAGGNFGWAANTTVAQQSQWLAEAVQLSSTHARLMIVWNIDIFPYHPNDDPQAGYAVIRPGGVCPACDAIAAVMP
jgi:hypothetical protein